MDLSFNLTLEQKQQLLMTQDLRMSIELLEYTSQELEEFVEKMLEENPMLERKDIVSSVEYDNDYSKNDYRSKFEGNDYNFENYIAYKQKNVEFLEEQLFQVLDKDEILIGRFLIGSLDEYGFLDISLKDVSDKFKILEKKAVEILNKIQHLDPLGIGARDFKEFLLIQIDELELNADKELMQDIIINNYEEFNSGNYKAVLKKRKESPRKILNAIKSIKTLRSYPTAGFFGSERTKYIKPDLVVRKVTNDFEIICTNNINPSLYINQYYYRMLNNTTDSSVCEYLKEKYKAVMWLMRSIEQRRMTIYKIAAAIVKKQTEFISKGLKYMKVLTMEEISEMINMHESTVSRATTGKYMQVPQGLFEMKFFFDSGVDNTASVSIKLMIYELIKNEDSTSPLSDNKIKNILQKQENISLSRRTVAKYRSQMGIPSSIKRKKLIEIDKDPFFL